ncbi:prolipoprotein diacylglyceryl transferase [Gordonia aichiensis]|uniref:prolipoprotein diacylglyceryl transferase n=1 Tax=Gordonia aichiensis TaxID=36820 RepID=UPI003D766E9E
MARLQDTVAAVNDGTVLAYIPSPSQGVWHLGPVPIRAYALCIIVGIIVAVWWGSRRWRARGGQPGEVIDVALWAVPFGLVGGRLYHVLTDWNTYFGPGGKGLGGAFRIWDGGLGIWGAVALGAVGAWIGARNMGIKLPPFGDALAPAILLAQAIGRFGNYFNQELFGRPTTVPWGLEIYDRVDANGIVSYKLIDGVSTGHVYAVVHPTFLYEMIWNVLVVIALVLIDRRFRIGHGRLFAMYVAGYCVGRFGVELMRDDFATHIFGVRINVFTAAIVFLCAALYVVMAPKGRETGLTMYWPDRAEELAAEGATGYVTPEVPEEDADEGEGGDEGDRGAVDRDEVEGTAAAAAAGAAAATAAATVPEGDASEAAGEAADAEPADSGSAADSVTADSTWARPESDTSDDAASEPAEPEAAEPEFEVAATRAALFAEEDSDLGEPAESESESESESASESGSETASEAEPEPETENAEPAVATEVLAADEDESEPTAQASTEEVPGDAGPTEAGPTEVASTDAGPTEAEPAESAGPEGGEPANAAPETDESEDAAAAVDEQAEPDQSETSAEESAEESGTPAVEPTGRVIPGREPSITDSVSAQGYTIVPADDEELSGITIIEENPGGSAGAIEIRRADDKD